MSELSVNPRVLTRRGGLGEVPLFCSAAQQLLEIDRNYRVEGDRETLRHCLTSTSLNTSSQQSSFYDPALQIAPELSGLNENIILEAKIIHNE